MRSDWILNVSPSRQIAIHGDPRVTAKDGTKGSVSLFNGPLKALDKFEDELMMLDPTSSFSIK